MMKKLLFCLLGLIMLAGCSQSAKVNESPVADADYSTRMVAYTSTIELKVSDMDKAKTEIKSRAEAMGGHMLEMSNKRIVVNVPSKELDSFIEYLDKDVGTIRDKQISGTDITDSYDDTSARLAVLVASRDNYMNLLKKSATVEDTLKIEKELERINTEIQKLETQKKRTDASVSFAKVTINLDDVSTFARTTGNILTGVASLSGLLLLIGLIIWI